MLDPSYFDVDFRANPASLEAICTLELFGAIIFENVISRQTATDLADLETTWGCGTSSYDINQAYCHNLQWTGQAPLFAPLRNKPLIGYLERLFGDKLVCTGISFSTIQPGFRGMALHADGKPHRSDIFGAAATSPIAVRVLIYPDGTDTKRAPLIFVPGSHLSMHADASPYRRYRSHADEIELVCPPGGAIIIHHRVFHRAGANTGTGRRRLFAYGLRPAWAGPIMHITEPSGSELSRIPADLRPMFKDPNRGSNPAEDINHSKDFAVAGPDLSRSLCGRRET